MRDTQFAQQVVDVLDRFKETPGIHADRARVVYVIIIGQVFKRFMRRFGFRSTGALLRNLYQLKYRTEVASDQAAAASSNGVPGASSTGNRAGRRPDRSS